MQRGGGLQSAVDALNGDLEIASPLASALQRGGGLQSAVGVFNGDLEIASPLAERRIPDKGHRRAKGGEATEREREEKERLAAGPLGCGAELGG